MSKQTKNLSSQKAELLPSQFLDRFNVNKKYVMSLKNENLLQNYYLEAGIKSWSEKPEGIHWGWESPECQLRGHFLGHWLSGAAKIYRQTHDEEVKGKADNVLLGLEECQIQNGGKWAGSIPEKYFNMIANGKRVWAPHYTVHKTFMGLIDMYKYAESDKAVEIADRWADWFHEWSGQFTREQMDDILDFETGGMLEVWADLYSITKNDKYKDLMERYDRPRLFDKLLAGEDPLSEKHANTTIPEIHGAARAWEVTKNERYRKIVEAYWKQAVDERGYFCTGGQTNAEAWTPKKILGTKLGTTNQEHCVVYNMIRLADFLFRWTGDVKYADYIERNIYNGIFAQQNINTGMVIYYLPLKPNSTKRWGTPTEDFWCCHGTLVQAHASYDEWAYFEDEEDIIISQYIPSKLKCRKKGADIEIVQNAKGGNSDQKAKYENITVSIKTSSPVEFNVAFRIPWWVKGKAIIKLNGQEYNAEANESSFVNIKRIWNEDMIEIMLPKKVYLCPLPDMPDIAAFMYGPIVLAGLSDGERTIYTDGKAPEDILRFINLNRWDDVSFYTTGQPVNFEFIPLYNVIDEKYTLYFPIK